MDSIATTACVEKPLTTVESPNPSSEGGSSHPEQISSPPLLNASLNPNGSKKRKANNEENLSESPVKRHLPSKDSSDPPVVKVSSEQPRFLHEPYSEDYGNFSK